MIDERGLKTRIEIDGGVTPNNIAEIAAAGVDIVVAASAIFGESDRALAVRQLREAAVRWV